MKRGFQNLFSFVTKFNIPICLFGLYVCITHAMGFQNCLLKLVIGYPCPGCGMTRATLSFLQLDFVKAFTYNPFVFLLPLLGIGLFFSHTRVIQWLFKCKWLWIGILLLVVVVYILRFVYVYPNVPMDYYEHNLVALFLSLFK
ncbi:MAG: DUF2752 domain-containing protein [Anaeroplasmataceae bacterium]|nr:DUF2752 domain-containing protein [Anaeroplasmataceae bacterium]